jgi:hypothetical protein
MEITITEYHAESNNEDFEPTLFEGFDLTQQQAINELNREEHCECGITEQGAWSETLFDHAGCDCD